MNNIISIFTLFSLLVGVMLFGLWSNVHVYAQQSPSVTSSPPKVSKPISEELKAKMCDPSNPDLKVVNTTEARICGIAKTVKPGLASAVPTSQSTSVVSSPTQRTVTTKPTMATTAPPKQQQIANTNNIPRSSGSSSPIAPLSHPTSTSLSGIAPQVEAVKQQRQPPLTLINSTAGINTTAGQNYTFAAISPAPTSGQVLYLGFHGTVAATNPTHGNSGSKQDDSNNSDNHGNTRRVSDSSSKDDDGTSSANKKTSSTKSDRTESTNAESSSKDKNTHNGESSSDSRSSSKKWTKSDDGSSKQDDDSSSATSSSHSENGFSSVIMKSFNSEHYTNSDRSGSSSIDDHIPSVIMKSFNFN
ncbi:MAG TPA: hypothetical protein VE643_06030 [Nitrososphaeraceae archaeon]|nr:hypothetical protein [Nitrososphaeraceae archaeon]